MRVAMSVVLFAMTAVACSGSASGVQGPGDGGSVSDAGGGDSAGGDDSATADDSGGGGDSTSGDDAADASSSAYPSGPYGASVGSVIQDMQWIGYVDDAADAVATTKPYVKYSLDDARKSGKKYAMINLAETYCPGCQKSAGEIAQGGAAVVNAGGVVIEVLETTGFTTQASQNDLQAWVNKYSLPVTTVKDPDGTGTPTLNTLGGREQAYIVDLSTMKIVQVIQGDVTGFGATSGGKAMTAMHQLLGK